jgi:GxxExxY protein
LEPEAKRISRRGAEAQRMTENEIGTRVIEAAIAVHRELGPGLLETVYEVVLARELSDRGLRVIRQVPVPIEYKGIRFDEGFRADLIVEDKVILEAFASLVKHANAPHEPLLWNWIPTQLFEYLIPRKSGGSGTIVCHQPVHAGS